MLWIMCSFQFAPESLLPTKIQKNIMDLAFNVLHFFVLGRAQFSFLHIKLVFKWYDFSLTTSTSTQTKPSNYATQSMTRFGMGKPKLQFSSTQAMRETSRYLLKTRQVFKKLVTKFCDMIQNPKNDNTLFIYFCLRIKCQL